MFSARGKEAATSGNALAGIKNNGAGTSFVSRFISSVLRLSKLLSMLIPTFGAIFLCIGAVAAPIEKPLLPHSQVNVRAFGARGDGKTDDTAAFQKAMDSLKPDGGIATVPTGKYLIKTHLNIPDFVTLEGVWREPAAYSQLHGSTLLAVEGAGSETGTPFITLNLDSTLKGITVFYPNQDPNKVQAYPWCVASGGGDDPTIFDCELVNPYQAVDFGTKASGRHYIHGLYGQPLRRGIFIDKCYDVGRLENIHFWPFWSWAGNTYLQNLMASNAEAFIFGRTDWEAVTNTFCLGYSIGYHFINTAGGPTNGSFLGIGSDASVNAVVVEQTQTPGLLITNGEFVAIAGAKPVEVLVNSTNTGVVQFQNCAFWGSSNHIATIAGTGYVSFNNCNFRDWDLANTGIAALDVTGGKVMVDGCNFSKAGPQVLLEGTAKAATFMGNNIEGPLGVQNTANADLEMGLNIYNH